jgi:16S rRNA processing protein RimM
VNPVVPQHGAGWVTAGHIVRAHGVHGELRVHFDIPLEDVPLLRVIPRLGEARTLKVEALRPVHGAALLRLAEVGSREAAQALAGATLQVDASALPPPEADEAYVFELAGATVRDEAGTLLGVAKEVLDNAGQPLLVLDADGTERLLPLVPATQRGYDREARALTVRVPEGLWE